LTDIINLILLWLAISVLTRKKYLKNIKNYITMIKPLF